MTASKSCNSEFPSGSLKIALGGLLAMAAALGIGRFVYTPILPEMIDALRWSKADAGVVASANFLGYLFGAVMAGWPVFAAAARKWLVVALAVSAATTAAMGLPPDMVVMAAIRFTGGVASAFVIICASTVVLDRLAAAQRPDLAAVHFAGVGAGICVSAGAVAAAHAGGMGWRSLWVLSGMLAAVAALAAAVLLPPAPLRGHHAAGSGDPGAANKPASVRMVIAYGLFGFGYVITATFLVAIVRQSPGVRPLEPWIWMLFGLTAVPSVPLWQWLGRRTGLTRAFAAAAIVEAIGVAAASADQVTAAGACAAAALLGGTFMGLTALGLMSGRVLGGDHPQRLISLMTVSFSVGQIVGPFVAGILAEHTGSLRLASLLAAAALVLAAGLAASPATNPRGAAPR
jgi:predicted MFS family arabinose efflux permease